MAEFRSIVVSRHARVGIVGDLATAREIWMVLHGYGMLARGILHWFKAAEAPGRALVAPEGLSRFYSEMTESRRVVGASWVTREDLENEVADQAAYLDQAVAEFVPPATPLHVHGFSQGVSVGTRWVCRTTRTVDRLVCWAGSIPDDVSSTILRAKFPTEPVHLMVGNRDVRVPPERVEADAKRLEADGVLVKLHVFDGGHRVDNSAMQPFLT